MLRAAVYPLAAVAVLALAFLLVGPKYALGALASGVAVSAGGWVAARMALGGGALGAGSAMARLIVAIVAKWALVFGVLMVGEQRGRTELPWPPITGAGIPWSWRKSSE